MRQNQNHNIRGLLLKEKLIASLLLFTLLPTTSVFASARTVPFLAGQTIDPGAESVEPCGPTDANCFPSAGTIARVATTAAGVLATGFANGSTVDGVVLATNDIIVIKNQVTASENGIYRVNSSGTPTLLTKAVGASVFVTSGTSTGTTYYLTSVNTFTSPSINLSSSTTLASSAASSLTGGNSTGVTTFSGLTTNFGATANASNNFGIGAGSINVFGSPTSTNSIQGATTFSQAVTFSGSATFSTLPSLPLANGSILIGNATNIATAVVVAGDATLSNAGSLTLANSGVSAGTYGVSATTIPTITVDSKGRVTSASSYNLSSAAVSGDVTGTLGAATVSKIQGKDVVLTSPTAGQILQYDGTNFVNATPAAASGSINVAVGTSGTDFNVSGSPVSLGGTVTLNIPDASATARGLVTIGAQTIAGNKTFTGNLLVGGTSTLSGNTSVGGTLGVTGATTLSSTLTVNGNQTNSGDVTLSSGNLSVGGTSTLTGNTSVGGILAVTGNQTNTGSVTINGAGTGLTVTNNASVGGTLGVTGNTTLAGSLGVTGAATLNSNLSVTGASTLTGNVSAAGNITVAGGLSTLKGTDYSSTGSVNDVALGAASLVRYTGSGTATFTGIAGGTDGKILTIINANTAAANTLTLSNDSVLSAVNNRIRTQSGSNLVIPSNGSVTLVYDSGSGYWRANSTSTGGGAAIGGNITNAYPTGILYADTNGNLGSVSALTYDPGLNKLTLTGGLDPLYVQVKDVNVGGNAAYFEAYAGQSAAVSVAGTGRIRYNGLTSQFEQSLNGGAYAPITNTTTALSSLTAATANSTINNANFTQNWGWQLTGATNGLNILENTASTGTGYLVSVGTLASSSAKPLEVKAQGVTVLATDASGNFTFSSNLSQTGGTTFSTGTGAVSLNGNTTISGTNTFTTGTGAIALNGSTTLAAGKNFTATSGTGGFDFSGASGSFATSTGTISINGDTTLAAGKNFTVGSGAGAFDFSGGAGIFKTSTGTNTFGGNVVIAGANSFTSGTGAVSLNGNVTVSGANTFTSGTGNITLQGATTVAHSSGITLNPYGAASGNTTSIKFAELAANGTNYVAFKAPDSLISNLTYTLPSTDGASGYTLTTDGGGNLTWTAAGACASCLVQNGNSFGATIAIGSNDSNPIQFRTNSITALTLDVSQNAIFAGDITVSGGDLTSPTASALNITSGTTGAVTLDSGTTGAVNVGTGASAKNITIGNTTGSTTVTLNAGSGGVVLNGSVSGTAVDTDGTLAANSDTKIASQKAVKTYISNFVNGLSWRPAVAALDSTDTSKPTSNPVIDGRTIALNDRVLFTALSGGQAADNNKVWKATSSLGSVVWTLETDGQAGTGAPTTADSLFATNGTANGSKNYTYSGSVWVLTASVNGGLVATNNLSDVSSVSSARTNLGLGTSNTPTFGGLVIGSNGNISQTGTGTLSTGSGGVSLNGNVSIASGMNFIQAGAGTFGTGTGAVSLNGDTTVAGGGAFTTGTGDVTINGSTYLSNAGGLTFNPYGVIAGNTSSIKFAELAANGTNYVAFKAKDNIAANVTWVLPGSDGTTGQILATDGGGNLSWTSVSSAPAVSSLTAAIAVSSINNANFAQTWNWNSATTENPITFTANTLTSGNLLSLSSTGTSTTGNLISVSSASTGAFSNGGVRFNFTGDHTGNGVQIDDVTTAGRVFQLNANSLTTGVAQKIQANNLTTGVALSVVSTSTGLTNAGGINTGLLYDVRATGNPTALTGSLATVSAANTTGSAGNTGNVMRISDAGAANQLTVLDVDSASTALTDAALRLTSASTGAFSNGGVRFNFTGDHTGNGVQIDDVTTAGRVFELNADTLTTGAVSNFNANALTSGSVLNILSSSTGITSPGGINTGSLLTVKTSGANTGITGSLAVIAANDGFGNAGNTGTVLRVADAGVANQLTLADFVSASTSLTDSVVKVSSPSTGAFTNGGIRFNFTGDHTGNGVQIDDVSTAGKVLQINANSVTSGTGLAVSATALTTGSALNITGASLLSPFGTSTGNTSEARFGELTANGTNYVGFKSPDALAGNVVWTLPAADGSAGQFLSTNGSGVLSWTTPGSTISGLTAATSGNTIDNTSFTQTWNWSTATTQSPLILSAGALTSGSLLTLSSLTGSTALNITGGNLGLAGNFAQTGSSAFSTGTGAVALNGATFVSGSNTFTVGTGATSLGGNLSVMGNSSLTGTLSVTGNQANSGTLTVAGATITAGVTNNGNLTNTGTLSTSGNFAVNTNKFTVTASSGDTAIAGALGVTGLASFNGGAVLTSSSGLTLDPYNTAAGNTSEIRFAELAANGTNYVGFKAADTLATNVIWSLPAADGTAGQVLKTDGAGNLSWVAAGGSSSFSGLTAATATNTIDNLNFAQTWNWSTASTQNPLAISANALTSGNLFALSSTSTSATGTLLSTTSASTGAFSNGGVRFNFTGAHTGNGVQVDDATVAGTAMAINTNSVTTGTGLSLTGNAVTSGNVLAVNTSTVSNTTNGVVRFNFTGTHSSGTGFLIDDSTLLGSAMKVNANSTTTGTGVQVNVNALTSGIGMRVQGGAASTTGHLFNVTSNSAATGNISNGLVRFDFQGNHGNNGFQIDDVTTGGTAMKINVNSLSTGTGLSIQGTNAGMQGQLLAVTSSNNTSSSNGVVRYDFQGTHGIGNGFQIDDATTSGAAMRINVNSLTAGDGLDIVSTSTAHTGSLQTILLSGNNAANTGKLLTLQVSGSSSAAIPLNIVNSGTGLSANIAGGVAFNKGTDYSTVGSTNDVSFGNTSLVRLTGASAQTITGIASGADGKLLTIMNAGATTATLANQSVSSTAANRIITGSGGDLSIAADTSVLLQYDSGASRWRVLSGGAASTVQSITSNTTITGWDKVILVDTTSGDVTVTLPTAVGSSGHQLQIKKTSSDGNAVIIDPNSTETIDGQTSYSLSSYNGSIIAFSDGTNIKITGNTYETSAEYGSNTSITDSQQTTSATYVDVTGGSITLPSAGVWNISYTIVASNGTAGSGGVFHLVDSTSTEVSGSILRSGSGQNGLRFNGTQNVQLVTTGAATYKLQWKTQGGGTLTLYNDSTTSNANSGITYQKIAGYLPSIGQTVDYGVFTLSAAYGSGTTSAFTNLGVGHHFQFNSITTGNILLDTSTTYTSTSGVASVGRIPLSASKTYRLTLVPGTIDLSANGATAELQWYDVGTGTAVAIGTPTRIADRTVTTDTFAENVETVYTPTSNTTVELRIVSFSTGGMANLGRVGASSSQGLPVAIIQQLGSTAATGIALSSLTSSTSANVIENSNYAQVWDWSTLTSETGMAMDTGSTGTITTGTLLGLTSAATTLTTAGSNVGSLLQVQASGATTAFTGNLASISMTNAAGAAGNTGTLLNIADAGAANLTRLLNLSSASTTATGNLLSFSSASAGAFTNGGVRYNFTGNHTNNAIQIDDVTTAGKVLQVNANSATTGTALAISANALTTGKGLSITSSSGGLFGTIAQGTLLDVRGTATQTTGFTRNLGYIGLTSTTGFASNTGVIFKVEDLATSANNTQLLVLNSASTSTTNAQFDVTSASTANTANGIARFNFSGAHTGTGLSVNDQTLSGTAVQINANSLTTGGAFEVNANALTTGTAALISTTSTTHTGPLLTVSTGSTGNLSSGGVQYAFTGTHTGTGFGVNDNTQTGTAVSILAGSLTTGTGLSLSSTNVTTGNLLSVSSSSTGAVTSGLARFNFTGAHTGNGIQLDDVTTSGKAMQINANSVTTGTGLGVSATALTTGAAQSIVATFAANGGAGSAVDLIYTTGVDTTGTNTHNGINITPTIGNATAGSNTANLINIGAVTGDAQVSLNAMKIGTLTGTAATERAISIGSGWDCAIYVNATCAVDGNGGISSLGLSSLTAATASNSIDSTNFTQTWNWSTATTGDGLDLTGNSLTTGNLLSVSSTSAYTGTNNTSGLLNVTGNSIASGDMVRFQATGLTTGHALTVSTATNTGLTSGSLLVLNSSGAMTGFTGNFASIEMTGANTSGSTGNALNVQVGGTANKITGIQVTQSGTTASATGPIGIAIAMPSVTTTSGLRYIKFTNAAGTEIGSIQNTSASAVNIFTSSDSRMKLNQAETAFGLNDLMKVEVKDFDWLEGGTHDTGFIAQQLYTVYPKAVSKGDNGTDAYVPGATNTWGVDYSAVTPLIVKSVQDLNKLVFAKEVSAGTLAELVEKGDMLSLSAKVDTLVTTAQEQDRRISTLENKLNDSVLETLKTTGGISIASLDTFAKNGMLVIESDVDFHGHLYASKDTTGVLTVKANEPSVRVSFDRAYKTVPNVVVTPLSNLGTVNYWLSDRTESSFTLNVGSSILNDVDFTWIAIAPSPNYQSTEAPTVTQHETAPAPAPSTPTPTAPTQVSSDPQVSPPQEQQVSATTGISSSPSESSGNAGNTTSTTDTGAGSTTGDSNSDGN